MPSFAVKVTPYEREGSSIKGLARIYLEDSFIINNVSILQGKKDLFVAMPSYRTRQTDKEGKLVYQDICFPITKEFREKLYNEILGSYREERERTKDGSRNNQNAFMTIPDKEEGLPIR